MYIKDFSRHLCCSIRINTFFFIYIYIYSISDSRFQTNENPITNYMFIIIIIYYMLLKITLNEQKSIEINGMF